MRCSIKKRVLPEAPEPTKPKAVEEVAGIAPHHLEVRPAKKRKRRKPVEAIENSVKKKMEAKAARRTEAIRLWKAGVPMEEIAEKLGVKKGAIYDYTREHRDVIAKGELYKYDDDIIRLFNEGKTYREIADAVGINVGNVADKLCRLRKHGQVRRRKKSWTVYR